MLTSLELIAAGACMGGSVTGFAVSSARESNAAFFYNLIMMVIGTLAASLVFTHPPSGTGPVFAAAVILIAGSLALAAIRAMSTRSQGIGLYLCGLSAAVGIAFVQTLGAGSGASSAVRLFT